MRASTKRTSLLLALILAPQLGCAALLSQLAKTMAPPAQATSTLNDVVLTTVLESNLPPAELGTISQSFFDGWKTGGDGLVLMFTKKGGPGYYRIDGTVTVDGKPAEYVTIGLYSVITEAKPQPRHVEITTSSGEKSSFTIEPSKKRLKVLSINGEKNKPSLDLTKDVVVELEGQQLPAGTLLKVSLAINQVGVKSFYEVANVRYQPKLTLPAAAFRNINIKPGASLLYGYDNSFLSVAVESIEDATAVSGAIPSVQYTSGFEDGMFVSVSNEPKLNPGLNLKGTDKNMEYAMFKPSAFLSRPSRQIKKVGLLSLSIRGTTFHQSSESTRSSNTLVMGGIANTTTTTRTVTTTLEFPRQTDESWDKLLESLYPAFMEVLTSEFNAEEVPVDKITGTEAYSSTAAFANDDTNTKVEFARSFRKTKVLSAFMPVSEGYGENGVNQRIMKESGADTLVTLTLDLEIAKSKKDEVLMRPRLAFEVAGKANGTKTNTKFFTGTIDSITGVTFAKDITPAELDSVVRKSDLMNVFRKALKEMKEQEAANGDYVQVWNLQE